MNRSESIKELAIALSKSQSCIAGAVKDSENPFFKSSYADLESVWNACRKPLTENGFAVIQMPTISDDGKVCVETTLIHSSGEWVSDKISATPVKNDPQGIGSVISYLRRYSLASIVGVYQTDDDAESAQGRTHTVSPSKPPIGKPQEKTNLTPHPADGKIVVSEYQAKRFYAIAKGTGVDDNAIKSWLNINFGWTSTKQITKEKYEEVCKRVVEEIKVDREPGAEG